MIEAGVIGEDERIELVEGEIVVMATKSVVHDLIQNALNLALSKTISDGLFVGNGSTLQLTEDVLVEPDLAVISRAIYNANPSSYARPTANDVLLIIRVEPHVRSQDQGASLCSTWHSRVLGYRCQRASHLCHTRPSGDGWSSIVKRGPDDVLTTPAVPGFSFRLGDISL
jgi:hypothetical protein